MIAYQVYYVLCLQHQILQNQKNVILLEIKVAYKEDVYDEKEKAENVENLENIENPENVENLENNLKM